MNAEFNWWLLIVGLVVGAGLVWLVIADWSRREEDLAEDERSAESAWIAQVMRDRGEALDPAAAEEVLALHRAYLRQTGMAAVAASAGDEPEEAGDEVLAAESTWAADVPGDEAGWLHDGSSAPGPAGSAAGSGPWPAGSAGPSVGWPRPAGSAGPDPGLAELGPVRPSVRTPNLHPRSGTSGLESDPPT